MATPIVALAGVKLKLSLVPADVATLPLPADSRLVGYGFKDNNTIDAGVLAAMAADARADWHREGHPGWTVVTGADGATFNDMAGLRAHVARNVVRGVAMLNLQPDVEPRPGRERGHRLRFWT